MTAPHASHPAAPGGGGFAPRLIAWEVTRRCVLACRHCRAAARAAPYTDELTTDQCRQVIDNIASFARPILILTGGEPMLREDIYEIASHASGRGLRVVMAPCGGLIDDDAARRIVESGIKLISISLDGPTPEKHDAFRGVPGAFEAALRGIEAARRAGLGFQINTTVLRDNLGDLPAMRDLAARLGARTFNPFLLVPTGRGADLSDRELSAGQYERTLRWLAGQAGSGPVPIRVTCAPHYQRIAREMGAEEAVGSSGGCMGGRSFAFISHRGQVQICGFLDTPAGQLRDVDWDFRPIWAESELFAEMRDVSLRGGRCGRCEYVRVCGGCRARAHAITGDHLAAEPFCTYEPGRGREGLDAGPVGLDATGRAVLAALQEELPVVRRPLRAVAERLGVSEEQVVASAADLRASGAIRRLGAVFDSARLGFVSTLVAARVGPARLDEVAAEVGKLPGVTHNYAREHAWNLWFTLTVCGETQRDETLKSLRELPGVEALVALPAEAVYKLRLRLPVEPEDANGPGRSLPHGGATVVPEAQGRPGEGETGPVDLDEGQCELIRRIQDDLPGGPEPFAAVAEAIGWPVERVLRQIAEWEGAGVIRRVGAIPGHRRLGFGSGGMAVFRVPPERVDEAGRRLARAAEVSHAYRRPSLPDFPYNLYAMIHTRSRLRTREVADELAHRIAAEAHEVLFSSREYKKTSMRYF